MNRLRLVTQMLIPWIAFFALYNHGRLELQVGIVSALVLMVTLNLNMLRQKALFEWCSVLFFIALFFLIIVLKHEWSILNIHLITMTFFALVSWYSLLIKNPITTPYIKSSFANEASRSHLFYELNAHLTRFWAVMFTINVLFAILSIFKPCNCDLYLILIPNLLLFVAFWFTFWFPDWYKNRVLSEGGVINIRGLSNLKTTDLPIATITYRTLGKGPIALLLPAAYITMYNWDPDLLEKLSKHFTVVICDYPDIGQSILKQGDFSVGNLANAFSEFIQQLSPKPVTVIGFSLGGRIAQKLAIKHRDLVKNLVLITTDVGSYRSKKPDAEIATLFAQVVQDPNKREALLMNIMFPPNVLPIIRKKMQAIFQSAALTEQISNSMCQLEKQLLDNWYQGEGTYAKLHEIEAKTLVISGEQDLIVDRQNSLLLVNGIPGAKSLEFGDAGHGVIFQHPDTIAAAIIELDA